MNKILNNLDLMSGPEWYDYQEQLNTVRSVPINLALVNRNVSTNGWTRLRIRPLCITTVSA